MSDEDWDEKGICPQCGSSKWEVADLLFIFGPDSGWLLECTACHHEWKYHPPPSGEVGLIELDLSKGTMRFIRVSDTKKTDEDDGHLDEI